MRDCLEVVKHYKKCTDIFLSSLFEYNYYKQHSHDFEDWKEEEEEEAKRTWEEEGGGRRREKVRAKNRDKNNVDKGEDSE